MKFILILLLFLCSFSLFSQNEKQLIFKNSLGNNLSDVAVFYNNHLVCTSDTNGACIINDKIRKVLCNYKMCIDTLIIINDEKEQIVNLNVNSIFLNEVIIKDSIDSKKLLYKLLKKSKKTANKNNLIVYYEFTETHYIPDKQQIETFSGILRVQNKGYRNKYNLIFVDSVSNYYNSIDSITYSKLPFKSTRIPEAFILDNLSKHSITHNKKNKNVENILFHGDTIIFKLSNNSKNVTTNYSDAKFYKNKIISSETLNTIKTAQNNLNFYYKIEYSKNDFIIPELIICDRELELNDSLLIQTFIKLKKINSPSIKIKLNKVLYGNLKEIISKIKKLNPNTAIPNTLNTSNITLKTR